MTAVAVVMRGKVVDEVMATPFIMFEQVIFTASAGVTVRKV